MYLPLYYHVDVFYVGVASKLKYSPTPSNKTVRQVMSTGLLSQFWTSNHKSYCFVTSCGLIVERYVVQL